MSTTPRDGSKNIAYKFLPAEAALKVLEQGRLKVTRLTELNDVFDCCPVFNPPDGQPWTEAWNDDQFKDWANWYGILCFSKTCTSPHLWGHYADHARGVALGFDMDMVGPKERRIDIVYEDRIPRLPWPLPKTDTAKNQAALLQDWFGTKAKVWTYEEEVRYVLELGCWKEYGFCTPEGGMYFYEVPENALRQVIVGYRSHITGRYLVNTVGRHYPHCEVQVMIARPSCGQYKMHLVPAF
jgi:hypothetical protein